MHSVTRAVTSPRVTFIAPTGLQRMAAGNSFSESRRYADEVLAGALSCVQGRIYLQSDCGGPQARPNVTTESISRVLSPDSLGSFSTQPSIVAPRYLSGPLDKSRSLGTVNENLSSNIEPPPAWARTINNQPDGFVQGPQHGSTGSPRMGRTAPPPPPAWGAALHAATAGGMAISAPQSSEFVL